MRTTITSLRERASRNYVGHEQSKELLLVAERLEELVAVFQHAPVEDVLRDLVQFHARSIRLLGITEPSSYGRHT